ncbi:hypothetical protein, partial [Blastomonas sp.]|uniref:hypothetical protein n=1 Tax=Blastomonas sp. TaxID=1909299 RepID=UPI00406A764F
GSAATDYTQGRLKMPPAGHNRIYTTLTDTTSDGVLAEVWHRKNPNYFMPIHELPRADQTIEQVVDEPWRIQTLIEFEDARAREGKSARSLRGLGRVDKRLQP